MNTKKKIIFLIAAAVLLSFTGCANSPEALKDQIYTEAVLTLYAEFTETAKALPSTETATLVPTNTVQPTATQRPVIIPTIPIAINAATPTSSSVNPYQVEFVWVDPYPNQFYPNQKFTLTWQLKNIGTATWSGKYRFYHRNGIQLADQSSYTINDVIAPGAILTISMPATSPEVFGTYQTEWALANPEGVEFYYVYYTANVGENTFITTQPSQSTSTPNSLYWMCSDSNRSIIQGNGCEEFCRLNSNTLSLNGLKCYSFGEQVTTY